MILEHQGVNLSAAKPLDVYLVALGEAAEQEVAKLIYELRSKGVAAERDYLGRKNESPDEVRRPFASSLYRHFG